LLFLGLCSASQARATDELAERKEISATTQQAFLSADFRKIEELSQAYRAEKTRTSSGLWKLTSFYAGIGAAVGGASNDIKGSFDALEDKTAKWAQQYPNSPAAHIARSIVLEISGCVEPQ
jgi:hypothetical protein